MLPVTLSDEKSGIEAAVDFDKGKGEFVFAINNEPFESLLCLDPSFKVDDADTERLMFSMDLSINGKVIHQGRKEWKRVTLQHAIWEKIDINETITSIKLENVQRTRTPIMNEILGLLVSQENIAQKGLDELVFHEWG